MSRCETVKVKANTKEGFKIINKSDFDESKDELFEAVKKRGPKPKAKTKADS